MKFESDPKDKIGTVGPGVLGWAANVIGLTTVVGGLVFIVYLILETL